MKEEILLVLGNVWRGLLSVPTRMRSLLTPQEMDAFNFSGAKAYRLIGALVTTIGVHALATGVAFWMIGTMGTARYEKLTGQFIRNFSAEDKGLYENADLLLNVSAGFLIVGTMIGTLGMMVLLRPQLIHDKLKDLGLLKEAEYV